MTENSENTNIVEDIPVDKNEPEVVTARNGRGAIMAWSLAMIPALLLVIGASGFGYLNSTGVDIQWAAGTSGWAAPPGTMLAGNDIGGKSYDEITATLESLPGEFANLSVWLVEDPFTVSIVTQEYNVSTAGDWIVLSVAPVEFGLSLNIDGTRRQLDSMNAAAGNTMAFGERLDLWQNPPVLPLVMKIDEEAVRTWVESVKSTVDCEPVDAVMDLPTQTIHPANDGLEVNVELTLENLPDAIENLEDIMVALAIERTQPDVPNEAFADIDIDNPLAEYTTHFNRWKRNRSFNIEAISVLFEAVVIQPGEIFSFDEQTGPRTYAEGYLAAPMYRNGRVEMSPAGGACQVSTTLYNVALLAGLEITERWPHGRPCGYVPYGRDATVAYGSVDLKFRNTLDHPIILHQEVDRHETGEITYQIYGHPDDRVNVEIGNSYSWIGRAADSDTYIIDLSLAPGEEIIEDAGTTGIHQRAWRVWYDSDGNELYTEQLSNDRVRPIGRLVRHNPDGINEDWLDPPPESVSTDISTEEPPEEEYPPGFF